MTMPLHFVVVRHGESEGNVGKKLLEAGDGSLMEQLDKVHTEAWRLSPRGREQAIATSPWLLQEFPGGFTRYLTTWYIRAIETATLLKIPGANWILHPMLSERNWGQVSSATLEQRRLGPIADDLARRKRDGAWWSPAGGESVIGILPRVHEIFDALHREQSEGTVIAVCHGEVMWAIRILLERMSPWQFRELDESKNPHDRIHNCQVFHYTRVNPENPMDIRSRLTWMRSICPWDMSLSSNDWREVVHHKFSDDELYEIIERYPHFMIQDNL